MKHISRFGSRVRPAARWVLVAVGPLVLAFLLIRVVDVRELGRVLQEIRYSWALAALALMQLVIFISAIRWAQLHKAFSLRPASMGYHIRITYATSLATLALPQVLSPFSRFVLLLQDGYPVRRAGAGAALEKGLEVATYLTLGLFGSVYLGFAFGGVFWWVAAIAFALILGAAVLYLGRSRLSRVGELLVTKLSGVGATDAAHISGEITAMRPLVLLRLYGWSILIALVQATMVYLLVRSLGVGLSYPFLVATWGIVALSGLLPLSVSGIGTREAILVVAFDAVGHSPDVAVALGLLVMAVVFIGSLPGALEWLRRLFVAGRGVSPAAARPAAGVTPAVAGQPGPSEAR